MFIISKSSKTSILCKFRFLNPRTAVVFPTEQEKECENGVWNFYCSFCLIPAVRAKSILDRKITIA